MGTSWRRKGVVAVLIELILIAQECNMAPGAMGPIAAVMISLMGQFLIDIDIDKLEI